LSCRPIVIDAQPCIMTCAVDITARKESERHLERLAMTDALTGLANRAHFMAALTDAVEAKDDAAPREGTIRRGRHFPPHIRRGTWRRIAPARRSRGWLSACRCLWPNLNSAFGKGIFVQ
jgi:hypothetical protein